MLHLYLGLLLAWHIDGLPSSMTSCSGDLCGFTGHFENHSEQEVSHNLKARVAELVDARDLKSCVLIDVRVRLPSLAPELII